MLFLFSAATPIGIVIGILLSSSGDAVTEGVCNALAMGTFLYIAASEIVVEEFSVSKHGVWKYIAFILGMTAIACLMLAEGHHHHHGEGEHHHEDN